MIQRIYKKECSDVSHPFPTAVQKLGFQEAGYMEEEYFFEGTANVYEETGGRTRRVIHKELPYINRFLVRKPSDGERFSGNIVVEILNATAGFDIDRMWIVGAKELMRSGDIYVGITSKPDVLDSMKKADPERYAPISWKIPYDRQETPCDAMDRAALPRRSDCETGLFWDMLTEMADVLRTDTQFIPKGKKRYLYLAGWSQSAAYMYTYLNYFAFPGEEISVFDGYLAAGGVHSFVVPLNQEGYGKEMDIRRNMITYMPVPFISVQTESENAYFDGIRTRQEDSDREELKYRIYEIAGATHDTRFSMLDYYAGDPDMEKIGIVPDFPSVDDVPNDYPYEYCFYAVYRMLFSWVRDGICPPHGERIEVTEEGENKMDVLGNAVGGIRTPFLDVPAAVYYPYCTVKRADGTLVKHGLFGHTEPFSAYKLEKLYGNPENYRRLLEKSAEKQVEKGFLLAEDMISCVEEAVRRAEGYGFHGKETAEKQGGVINAEQV